MYLKCLKLAGFKSFVDATTIPIRSNINAVVGPNGCGKSNIVDAIRWVIGETSAKQLRGQSMTDIVFNGTSTRKPVGKALVELLFDNSEGRAGGEFAKFNEVSIRRELERGGQSNYFINGTLCRRRDIVDIFLGTGLGPCSYAIIEQGMISQLIEAKPEEFRVYLEEAAGISKYKERRRETEHRLRRTQDNLDRLKDLCEELAKQLRHLKRQANAAERYQSFKEEERLLHAQIKGLQWHRLANDLDHIEERINAATLQHEAQLADQRHVEIAIEKSRVAQTEANDQQNDAQKRYYALGTEIARAEQHIKDLQEQTQRWRDELDEAERLWQELTEGSAEHHDQIQKITEDIAALLPQKKMIQAGAEAAQQSLHEAEATMQRWQEAWDAYQKTSALATQRTEVARTNISHYEHQREALIQREQRLLQDVDPSQLETLHQALGPMDQQTNDMGAELDTIQSAMHTLSEQIVAQRRQNMENSTYLYEQRRELQADEGHYASLQSLQEAALSGDQQANDWLEKHNLAQANRLGKTLRVDPGWELAVEIVLSDYFDAVCVDDVATLAIHLDLDEGSLTLVDHYPAVTTIEPKATSLAEHIESDWPIATWLETVYTADSTQTALSLRDRLSPQESVITKEGLWVGANWVRKVTPQNSKSGVLVREQALETLAQRIAERQKVVDSVQADSDTGSLRLAELENNRDQQHKEYQLLSQQHTQLMAERSAKRSRYDELRQQQVRLQDEMTRCHEQKEQAETALNEATIQLEQSSQILQAQANKKDSIIAERDHSRETLRLTRETAQREQQKADEFDIRLSSNESQLSLLKQTVSRAERQMQQISERRDHVTKQLADANDLLDTLNTELQEQLSQRISFEEELRSAEEILESSNQQVRDLEKKRDDIQTQLDDIKDFLQSVNIERQALLTRQTAIQEQLAESDFNVDTVLDTMPENASIQEWEERVDCLAQKINRLGPINLAAIEEYEQITERKTYLDKQQTDLHEALDVLHNAIRKIDRETRQKFKDTYNSVNAGFKTLFPKIFGGGRASLELEEDALLTSGIIVRAQPPGKLNSTIYMLSGGEKALTAIALVFALFQLNPAPFCVLDEVDAPLDDINVGRFSQLVKSMSEATQFIVISHNKVTLEMANHLMGVTMQEAGVSRIVSVDMEAAIAMTEE